MITSKSGQRFDDLQVVLERISGDEGLTWTASEWLGRCKVTDSDASKVTFNCSTWLFPQVGFRLGGPASKPSNPLTIRVTLTDTGGARSSKDLEIN